MAHVTLTAKRQATLPAQLCEELGAHPGDRLLVERRLLNGEIVWVLRARKQDWSWFGAAKRYGKGKNHRWAAVRANAERGWSRGRRS